METISSQIAMIAGVILSLAFAYIPGLAPWYDAQSAQVKSLTMLGALVVAAVGTYAATCWRLFDIPGLTCSEPGIRTLISAFIVALATNQSTYLVTRRL